MRDMVGARDLAKQHSQATQSWNVLVYAGLGDKIPSDREWPYQFSCMKQSHSIDTGRADAARLCTVFCRALGQQLSRPKSKHQHRG
jgi:hypothetical protein